MNTHNENKTSRMENTFAHLKAQGKKALVPFITAGDPYNTDITALLHALVKGGADVIELGIPFSDPAADGEAIQHASERAIANGISYNDCFEAVKKFRETDTKTPILLMGYLNPAEIHPDGFSGFANRATTSGVDAVILVDLSYESGAAYRKVLRAAKIDLINLISPTTTKTRLGKIVKNATGFIYYVSMRGITGAGNGLNEAEISGAVKNIRNKTTLPVCIGFGISDGETAKALSQFSDGIVVGSALVKKLYNASQNNEDVLVTATQFIASLRHALDD